jgi:hypothetical protein
MYRRRRRQHEIEFSFDSFLDVVANVVGIIIRLILVVWVSARAYTSLLPAPHPTPAAAAQVEQPLPADPLQDEVARHRQELAALQARLLEQLRHFQGVQEDTATAAGRLTLLSEQKQQLAREQARLVEAGDGHRQARQQVALSLAEVQQRCQKLTEEIQALEKQPAPKRVLRYQTPVSRAVHTDELLFECRRGRVTFIDIGALLAEVEQRLEDHAKELRDRWQVEDTAGPVGPFRLRYALERERGVVDAVTGQGGPDPGAGFHCGLSGWEVEPVTPERGETAEAALAPNSEFRQVADVIDPQQTTVTFWVYPDSFPLYRRLRDYLYQRDVIVAGRPLPEGTPIASSRHGTRSRGQ